jgi:hypothetical protein
MAKKKRCSRTFVEKNSCGFCGKTRNPDEDRLLRKLDATTAGNASRYIDGQPYAFDSGRLT